MLPEVQALIDHFHLQPLPAEGTLFAQTYRTAAEAEPGRPLGTAMIGLYCDEPRSVSLFHKLTTDEVWHFYAGDPLRLVLLYPDGASRVVTMGSDPLRGQQVQFVVPAGVWQAGELAPGGRYALYGCTLTPGFVPSIFTGGLREELLRQYPERADDIERLGCEPEQRAMPG